MALSVLPVLDRMRAARQAAAYLQLMAVQEACWQQAGGMPCLLTAHAGCSGTQTTQQMTATTTYESSRTSHTMQVSTHYNMVLPAFVLEVAPAILFFCRLSGRVGCWDCQRLPAVSTTIRAISSHMAACRHQHGCRLGSDMGPTIFLQFILLHAGGRGA